MRDIYIMLVCALSSSCAPVGERRIAGSYFISKSPYGFTFKPNQGSEDCVDLAIDSKSIEKMDAMVGYAGRKIYIEAKPVSGRKINGSEHIFDDESIKSASPGLIWRGKFFGLQCGSGKLYEITKFKLYNK